MSDDKVQLSFAIATPHDFLSKLEEEKASLDSELTSSRHAINAAFTAWHLIEWVWGLSVKKNQEVQRKIGEPSKDLKAFRSFVLNECPELEIMKCICEGSKHLGTESKAVRRTDVHGGAFDSGCSKGFDISRLQVEKFRGTWVYFDHELEKVLKFWRGFFATYLPHPE